MSLTSAEITEWAAVLAAARLNRVECDPISSSIDLTIDDAYAIQRAGAALRLERGEKVVGWKLGYTSLAMRAQMGIDQPNLGPLTDAMLVAHDGAASPALIQPRVEPEIGLRFDHSLPGDANLDEVLGAVGEAFACLEIVDSVYPNYRFRLEDNTADGSSAAQVVVGPALKSIERLDEVTVELLHNGTDCGSATGRAASGHPAAGVVWLVGQLALQGRHIEAGDIVITGGLTRAYRCTSAITLKRCSMMRLESRYIAHHSRPEVPDMTPRSDRVHQRIVVIRHAKSSWDDPSVADHDRPLSKRGRNALPRLRDHIEGLELRPELVMCSSSRRTCETLAGIRGAFGRKARVESESALYAASAEQLVTELRRLDDHVTTVVLIGHNPGVADLVDFLVADPATGGPPIDTFPTAAVAVLSVAGPWSDLQPACALLESFWAPRQRP